MATSESRWSPEREYANATVSTECSAAIRSSSSNEPSTPSPWRVVDAADDQRSGLAEGLLEGIRHGSPAGDQHPVYRSGERVEAGDQHRRRAGSGHGQQRVQRGQAVARDILDECQAEGEPGQRER